MSSHKLKPRSKWNCHTGPGAMASTWFDYMKAKASCPTARPNWGVIIYESSSKRHLSWPRLNMTVLKTPQDSWVESFNELLGFRVFHVRPFFSSFLSSPILEFLSLLPSPCRAASPPSSPCSNLCEQCRIEHPQFSTTQVEENQSVPTPKNWTSIHLASFPYFPFLAKLSV